MAASSREWERRVDEFLARDVPDDVLEYGASIVTDCVTAAIGGTSIDAVETIVTALDAPIGPATVFGTARSVEVTRAAFLNGLATVAPEIEEGHNHGGHVGATVVPAAFALAERADASGDRLVEAVVKGYEVAARIEAPLFAMRARMDETLPWTLRNPHSAWTTIGPAVAGGIALGLDTDQLRAAWRIAANLAVVSMHDPYPEGGQFRNAVSGFSAQAGVTAALSAAAGLTVQPGTLDPVYDPLRADETFDAGIATLSDSWESTRNYVKLVPSCRYTHPPLDALRVIRDQVDTATIERVDVHSFRKATGLAATDPAPETSAKFSIPYVLARYLHSGDPWLEDFTADAVADPDVLALARRVRIHVDEEHERAFPDRWSARVSVTHTDGRTVTGECEHPQGDYRNRPSDGALAAKYRRLLKAQLPADRRDHAFTALREVRARSARDVGNAVRTA